MGALVDEWRLMNDDCGFEAVLLLARMPLIDGRPPPAWRWLVITPCRYGALNDSENEYRPSLRDGFAIASSFRMMLLHLKYDDRRRQ